MASLIDIEIIAGITNLTSTITAAQRQLDRAGLKIPIKPGQVGKIVAEAQRVQDRLRSVGAISVNKGVQSLNKDLAQSVNFINRYSRLQQQATNTTEELGKQTAITVKRFGAFALASRSIFAIQSALSGAIKEAIEWQSQLTKVAQLTNTTRASAEGFGNVIEKLSVEFGVSANDLSKSATILAQAGKSLSETSFFLSQLAPASLTATFGDLAKTTENLQAVMNQFRLETSSVTSVLDSFNAVTKDINVTTDELFVGLTKAGATFSALDGINSLTPERESIQSLREFVALFSSVISKSRESAETVGTSLKTILPRLQRASTQQLLTRIGVDVVEDGKFVGVKEAIGRIVDKITVNGQIDTQSPEFARLVEALGGSRQSNRVIPLLTNFDTTKEAIDIQDKSAGSIAKDIEKAQETIQFQLRQTSALFQKFVNDFVESGAFNRLATQALGFANSLVKIADVLGPLLPLLATVVAVSKVGSLVSGVRKGFAITPRIGFQGGGSVPTSPVALTPNELVFSPSQVKRVAGGYNTLNRINQTGVIPSNFSVPNGVRSVPGTGSSDTFKTNLEPGSFVIRKRVSENIMGRQFAKNGGVIQGLNRGGGVGRRQNFVDGGLIDRRGNTGAKRDEDDLSKILGGDLARGAKKAADALKEIGLSKTNLTPGERRRDFDNNARTASEQRAREARQAENARLQQIRDSISTGQRGRGDGLNREANLDALLRPEEGFTRTPNPNNAGPIDRTQRIFDADAIRRRRTPLTQEDQERRDKTRQNIAGAAIAAGIIGGLVQQANQKSVERGGGSSIIAAGGGALSGAGAGAGALALAGISNPVLLGVAAVGGALSAGARAVEQFRQAVKDREIKAALSTLSDSMVDGKRDFVKFREGLRSLNEAISTETKLFRGAFTVIADLFSVTFSVMLDDLAATLEKFAQDPKGSIGDFFKTQIKNTAKFATDIPSKGVTGSFFDNFVFNDNFKKGKSEEISAEVAKRQEKRNEIEIAQSRSEAAPAKAAIEEEIKSIVTALVNSSDGKISAADADLAVRSKLGSEAVRTLAKFDKNVTKPGDEKGPAALSGADKKRTELTEAARQAAAPLKEFNINIRNFGLAIQAVEERLNGFHFAISEIERSLSNSQNPNSINLGRIDSNDTAAVTRNLRDSGIGGETLDIISALAEVGKTLGSSKFSSSLSQDKTVSDEAVRGLSTNAAFKRLPEELQDRLNRTIELSLSQSEIGDLTVRSAISEGSLDKGLGTAKDAVVGQSAEILKTIGDTINKQRTLLESSLERLNAAVVSSTVNRIRSEKEFNDKVFDIKNAASEGSEGNIDNARNSRLDAIRQLTGGTTSSEVIGRTVKGISNDESQESSLRRQQLIEALKLSADRTKELSEIQKKISDAQRASSSSQSIISRLASGDTVAINQEIRDAIKILKGNAQGIDGQRFSAAIDIARRATSGLDAEQAKRFGSTPEGIQNNIQRAENAKAFSRVDAGSRGVVELFADNSLRGNENPAIASANEQIIKELRGAQAAQAQLAAIDRQEQEKQRIVIEALPGKFAAEIKALLAADPKNAVLEDLSKKISKGITLKNEIDINVNIMPNLIESDEFNKTLKKVATSVYIELQKQQQEVTPNDNIA